MRGAGSVTVQSVTVQSAGQTVGFDPVNKTHVGTQQTAHKPRGSECGKTHSFRERLSLCNRTELSAVLRFAYRL